MRFLLHCSGPGYWLLSWRVVPPPQSGHGKQLLSGESTHPIRHEKGHHIIDVSHTKVNLYIHTYIHSREITKTNWTKNLDILSIFATTISNNCCHIHTLFSIQNHWLFSSEEGRSELMWCGRSQRLLHLLTVVLVSMSAPRSKRISTARRWPAWAA